MAFVVARTSEENACSLFLLQTGYYFPQGEVGEVLDSGQIDKDL